MKQGHIFLVEKVCVCQRGCITSTIFSLHSDLSIQDFLLPIKLVEVHFSILVPKSGTNPLNFGKNSNIYTPKGGGCFLHLLYSHAALERQDFLGGCAHVLTTVHVAVIHADVWETFCTMYSTQRKEQQMPKLQIIALSNSESAGSLVPRRIWGLYPQV